MGAGQSSLQPLSTAAQALAFKPYAATDHAFWNELWSTPTTAAQLWGCVSDSTVAQIRDAQPANLACLLHKLLTKMADIVYASKGAGAAIRPAQPAASAAAPTSASATATATAYTHAALHNTTPPVGADDPVVVNTCSVLLNCVRILTRVMSVLVEQPRGAWWRSFLWGGDLPVASGAQTVGADPALLRGLFLGEPIGRAMLLLLLDLLFLEGFCVHPSLATAITNKESLRHNGVQLDKLWEVGVGVPSVAGGAPTAGPPNLPALAVKQWIQHSAGWSNFDSNRIEVLRCLLVLLAEPIYLPPNTGLPPSPKQQQQQSASASASSSSSSVSIGPMEGGGSGSEGDLPFVPNRFMREFVSERSACVRWTPTLTWSLLNVVLSHQPERPGGTTALAALPYNYLALADNREPLVETALHFLLLCMDFRHGELEAPALSAAAGGAAAQQAREKSVVVLNPPLRWPELGETEEAKGGDSPVVDAAAAQRESAEQAMRLAAVALSPPSPASSSAAAPAGQCTNTVHAILTELSNGAALTVIYSNICRLLLNALCAESTWFPQSLKKLHCFNELLVLAWKMADENPYFVGHVLAANPRPADQCEILALITPLLYFVHESRNDEAQLGLTYTAVFLLLRLSGSREFSVSLNRAVPGALPPLPSIPLFSLLSMPAVTAGSYGDALVVVAQKLVAASPNHLDALLKVLLTLLANVSPYLTRLSLFASVKIMALFELFAQPQFLYANETNHQYLSMMLDIFNNIIQYQYQGHSNLVYSILRRAKIFRDLARLEPPLGPGSAAPAPTVEEQQRRISAGSAGSLPKRDLHSSAKVPSAVTSTIELAERDIPRPTPAAPAPAASAALPAAASTPSASSGSSSASSSSAAQAFAAPPTPFNAFVPTAAWKNSWKQQLPLEPILRLLDFFEPKVDAILQANQNAVDESALLTLISQTTLVGVLPVPHPIVVRKYIPNHFTNLWFSTYLSGVVFLRQQSYANTDSGVAARAPLWNAAKVKMFVISNGSNSAAAAQQDRPQPQPKEQQQQQQQQQQSAQGGEHKSQASQSDPPRSHPGSEPLQLPQSLASDASVPASAEQSSPARAAVAPVAVDSAAAADVLPSPTAVELVSNETVAGAVEVSSPVDNDSNPTAAAAVEQDQLTAVSLATPEPQAAAASSSDDVNDAVPQ